MTAGRARRWCWWAAVARLDWEEPKQSVAGRFSRAAGSTRRYVLAMKRVLLTKCKDWVWREDRIQDLLSADADVLLLAGAPPTRGSPTPSLTTSSC